jgi:hypothetical protein
LALLRTYLWLILEELKFGDRLTINCWESEKSAQNSVTNRSQSGLIPINIITMKTLRLILLLICVTTLTEAQTVYITKTGSKYHNSGCRYLSRSKIPISLESAMRSYGPCSVCKPPTLVRTTPTVKTIPSSTATRANSNKPSTVNSGSSAQQSNAASTSLAKAKTRVAYITSWVDEPTPINWTAS